MLEQEKQRSGCSRPRSQRPHTLQVQRVVAKKSSTSERLSRPTILPRFTTGTRRMRSPTSNLAASSMPVSGLTVITCWLMMSRATLPFLENTSVSDTIPTT